MSFLLVLLLHSAHPTTAPDLSRLAAELIGAKSLHIETHPKGPPKRKLQDVRSASHDHPPLIIVPGMFSSAIKSTLNPLYFRGGAKCLSLYALHRGHYQSWLSLSELHSALSSCFTDSLTLEWDGETGDTSDPPGITTSVADLADHAAAFEAINCAIYNDAAAIVGGDQCVDIYGALFTFLRSIGYVDNVDLFVVPYDWRRGLKYWMTVRALYYPSGGQQAPGPCHTPPDSPSPLRQERYPQLQQLVEEVHASTGQKPWFWTLSQGGAASPAPRRRPPPAPPALPRSTPSRFVPTADLHHQARGSTTSSPTSSRPRGRSSTSARG